MRLFRSIAHQGFRRVAFYIHCCVGLFLGLWLVLVSLTGSLVVFRDEIEVTLKPEFYQVAPGTKTASVQTIYEQALRCHGGAKFQTVNLPRHPGDSLSIWGHNAAGQSFHVFANPHNGALLGSAIADDNVTEWIYLFHAQLLCGNLGEQLNGVGALAGLALLGSGVVLWWPRKGRSWRDGFLIRWSAQARRRNFDFHRAVGVWTALPLSLVLLTGIYFPFKAPFRWLAETLTRTSAAEDAPQAPPVSLAAARISLDEALRAGRALLPDIEPNWIRLPTEEREVYSLRKRRPGEWRKEGANFLHLDPFTGALLRADLHAERSPAQRFLRALFPLHVGTFAGDFSRWLWVVLGLVPALLWITGLGMWRRRTRPITDN